MTPALHIPSDAELAIAGPHSAKQWAHARSRLGSLFPATYALAARNAAVSGSPLAKAADDLADLAGVPRPKGWIP